MLDRQQHDYYLKRILRDIISDSELASKMALKGGTCLYLFYDLPRFSVDLDFNLVNEGELAIDKVQAVLQKYLDVENGSFHSSNQGWLWEASYEKGNRRFQVDINRRLYPDKYEVKQFYGLSIQTMTSDCMFAHKLCAIKDRSRFQNRDLFDSWFMFDKSFEINEEIVKMRTNLSVKEYLLELHKFISHTMKDKKILDGLGELLDSHKKTWVKEHLVAELLAQLELKIDSL